MSSSALTGQVIGKYRVLEALGRGGMAQVYKAYHPQLDRYVAIKVLRSDLVEDKDFLARFQREARAIASLRHQHIVQVFDFDAQDDLYYMVMELLEGDTLRARLNTYRGAGQRMPLPEVQRIMRDVLDGLGYAHQQGIIHRDIKPANILLTRRDEAVVTDFGIAQMVGATQATVSGALMGTLSYMAPEQGLQGRCDERSDLYSVGIVLYEMLTGYTPFDADTPLAILMKHLNDPLPLPRQLDPALPEVLERIVLKALAKNPEDRYQNAAEMAAALQQVSSLPDGARGMLPAPLGIAPGAVFSGTSRHRITDARFAQQDTDPDLARSLAAAGPSAETPATGWRAWLGRPINTTGAILGSLGVAFLVNFGASMFSTLTNLNLYRFGWAFEIFLLAGFLAMLMWAIQTVWLLVPTLIVLGNGLLLAYAALTGRWGDWVFLWMLEPLIIAGAIILPLMIKRRSAGPEFLARAGGALLSLLALLLIAGTCLASALASLMR
jgi:tRNA A-37 threonylcarbamoyl transferase component Bud32